MLPAEIIRTKRDGGVLSATQIAAFVKGLVAGTAGSAAAGADEAWSDSQAAALAMAIVLRGMDATETVALTAAMTRSGDVLDWRREGFDGPALDKHSTGGVGDKVSLMLAPIVAAAGAGANVIVPMISGRGLGHTGGTLDKLEALPGYVATPPLATMKAALREAGCAIVGASSALAPADARLYAIRDVTATVESVPLITASILSKKLAAGLDALLLDVKVGGGAVLPSIHEARTLAASLVRVARGAGLPARALITDMDQVLGTSAGNAPEVREAIAFLKRDGAVDGRLAEVTLAESAALLQLAGVMPDAAAARAAVDAAWTSGHAAERFARMVAALGGPADVLADPKLPRAPAVLPVPAPKAGWIGAVDTRALGLAVVGLGGGRVRPGQAVDPRVGLEGVIGLGARVERGQPLASVHAADAATAARIGLAVQAALRIDDAPPPTPAPVVRDVIDGLVSDNAGRA